MRASFYHHPPEFRLRAVRMLETRTGPAHAVARELGVRLSTIYRWQQSIREDGSRPSEEPSRTGYAARAPTNGAQGSGLEALTAERDQLLDEVRALRKTIVLLGRG